MIDGGDTRTSHPSVSSEMLLRSNVIFALSSMVSVTRFPRSTAGTPPTKRARSGFSDTVAKAGVTEKRTGTIQSSAIHRIDRCACGLGMGPSPKKTKELRRKESLRAYERGREGSCTEDRVRDPMVQGWAGFS